MVFLLSSLKRLGHDLDRNFDYSVMHLWKFQDKSE